LLAEIISIQNVDFVDCTNLALLEVSIFFSKMRFSVTALKNDAALLLSRRKLKIISAAILKV
jgi:hypothetical protein